MTQRIFKDPDFRGAFRLHEAFREAKPTRVRRVRAPKIPRALMQLGELEFVGYRTTHNGEVARYMHKFAPGSMPRLMAGPKRNQLVLLGGRYHVTDRGIVDLDAKGREIDDHVHGETVAEPRVQNVRKKLSNEKRDTEAYRGYLIRQHPITNEMWIEKDGHRIGGVYPPELDQAKAEIDALLD